MNRNDCFRYYSIVSTPIKVYCFLNINITTTIKEDMYEIPKTVECCHDYESRVLD